MVMSKDNVRTAFAATDNEDVRDRSNRTCSRQLSSRRHTALPRSVSRRSASTKLALALLMGAALVMFMPAAAQAGPLAAVVAVRSNLFPTGTPAPGGASGVLLVRRGSSAMLTAPQYLYQPATPPATTATVYEFMFWDVHTTLIATETAKFTVPSSGPL